MRISIRSLLRVRLAHPSRARRCRILGQGLIAVTTSGRRPAIPMANRLPIPHRQQLATPRTVGLPLECNRPWGISLVPLRAIRSPPGP